MLLLIISIINASAVKKNTQNISNQHMAYNVVYAINIACVQMITVYTVGLFFHSFCPPMHSYFYLLLSMFACK